MHAQCGVSVSGGRLGQPACCPAPSPARRVSRAHTVRVAAYRDARELRDVVTLQRKQVLETYNRAARFYPKVKFVLRHASRLGEVWKVVGSCPELGAWVPEVAPQLHWQEGHTWSAEIALPPGSTVTFKCLLRTAEGTYVWEGGYNRELLVPAKERAGELIITYHMDVRAEPGESFASGLGYSPMEAEAGSALAQRQGERALVGV